jgi:lipopolysaccharide export system protein LptC
MMAAPADFPAKKRPSAKRAAARSHVDWAVQARTTVHDAQRYTRFVGVMKKVLLATAAGLLLAVLAYALQPRDPKQYAMTFERMGRIANDLTMVKPRLMGSDSDGSPFVVTAEKGVQDPHNVHHAHLSAVEADLTAKDGAWYNINALRGFLDSDAQKLWLNGKLALFSDSGYELHTDSAFVDLAPSCDPKTGKPSSAKPLKPGKPAPRCAKTTIRGNREVTGQGPLGTLRADSFHIEKGSKHMFLDGHVKMVLYPANSGHDRAGKTRKATNIAKHKT